MIRRKPLHEKYNEYDFIKLYNEESNDQIKLRYFILDLVKNKKSFAEISRILNCSKPYVYKVVKTFETTEGLIEIQNPPTSSHHFKTLGQLREFKDLLIYQSAIESRRIDVYFVQEFIKNHYKKNISLPTIYRLMKRCGFKKDFKSWKS